MMKDLKQTWRTIGYDYLDSRLRSFMKKPAGKVEMYASKGAMKKHEGGEGSKMQAMEKKQGVKNVVAKKSAAKKKK